MSIKIIRPTSEDIQQGIRQVFWECIDNDSVVRNQITSEDIRIGVRQAVKQWMNVNRAEIIAAIVSSANTNLAT